MESAVVAVQCASAGPEKGEYLPPGLHSTAATPTTPYGEPRETLRLQDYRPQLPKGYKKSKPAAWLFPPPP